MAPTERQKGLASCKKKNKCHISTFSGFQRVSKLSENWPNTQTDSYRSIYFFFRKHCQLMHSMQRAPCSVCTVLSTLLCILHISWQRCTVYKEEFLVSSDFYWQFLCPSLLAQKANWNTDKYQLQLSNGTQHPADEILIYFPLVLSKWLPLSFLHTRML